MKFDVNNRKTQVVLVVVGIVFIGVMILAELSKDKKEDALKVYNPGKPKTQYELLTKRVSRNNERNVSDYSLEEIVANQINKNPFKKDTIKMVDTVFVAGTSSPGATTKRTKQKIVPKAQAKPKQQIVSIEKKKPKRRRFGFSGNSDNLPDISATQANGHESLPPQKIEIPAVIHQQMAVKSGDNITLRTTKKEQIGANIIPANTLITGIVSLNSNRLRITINGIQLSGRYLKKSLDVYDVDGVSGLRLSNDLQYELKNQGANAVIDEVSSQVNIPYLGSLSKSLAKKKVNNPRIPIKKGHPVFIKEKI